MKYGPKAKRRELAQGLEFQWRARRSGSEALGPRASREALWTDSHVAGRGDVSKMGTVVPMPPRTVRIK